MNLRIETSTRLREVTLPYEIGINPFDNEYQRVLMFTLKSTDHPDMPAIIDQIGTMMDRDDTGTHMGEIVKVTFSDLRRTLIIYDALMTLTGKHILYLSFEGSEYTWKLTNTKI